VKLVNITACSLQDHYRTAYYWAWDVWDVNYCPLLIA